MPVTSRIRRTGPSSFVVEVVERTPDRYALAWPGLVPFGALYAVDRECLRYAPELLAIVGLVSTGRACDERAATWFCDPADRWWLRGYFALERAYWWTLREVLYRRLRMIVPPEPGDRFAWRRDFQPLNPLKLALARIGGR